MPWVEVPIDSVGQAPTDEVTFADTYGGDPGGGWDEVVADDGFDGGGWSEVPDDGGDNAPPSDPPPGMSHGPGSGYVDYGQGWEWQDGGSGGSWDEVPDDSGGEGGYQEPVLWEDNPQNPQSPAYTGPGGTIDSATGLQRPPSPAGSLLTVGNPAAPAAPAGPPPPPAVDFNIATAWAANNNVTGDLKTQVTAWQAAGSPGAPTGTGTGPGAGYDPNSIQLNQYGKDTLYNQEFLRKMRGEAEARPFGGIGPNGDKLLGPYGVPAALSLQRYRDLQASEKEMLAGAYDAPETGVSFADILAAAKSASIGRKSFGGGSRYLGA